MKSCMSEGSWETFSLLMFPVYCVSVPQAHENLLLRNYRLCSYCDFLDYDIVWSGRFGIAMDHGIDGQGSSPWMGKIFLFSTAPRPILGPTQPPIQLVRGALPPGLGVKHLLPPNSEVKNGGAICLLPYTPWSINEAQEQLYFHNFWNKKSTWDTWPSLFTLSV
jgi:hypothetical protein